MNYFLKILGSTKMKATDDAIEFFTKSGSLFWEKNSTIVFGERAWSRVQKGDILIQYIPLGFKSNAWKGRIVGCYRATSLVRYKNYRAPFGDEYNHYCEVENLTPKFSLASINKSVLTVRAVEVEFNGEQQSGIMGLSVHEGQRIFNAVMEEDSRL